MLHYFPSEPESRRRSFSSETPAIRVAAGRWLILARCAAGAAAALAAGLLSSCTIEMLTPTVEPTRTLTSTPELPLTSLLPTLESVPTGTVTPTRTGTPDVLRPAETGQRIYFDPLDGSVADWTLMKTSAGTVDFSGGMLVFTVNTPYTSLVSRLPRDFPDDVYVETTVETLLCGEGQDTFGIIFHMGQEYSYRYAVTCLGQLRFERFKDDKLEGASVWKDTLGLLQGAPATNRIGVLIRGRIYRFFVGGIEVFSGQDPMSEKGGVGLFVRSDKSNVLSVGFDEISVYTLVEAP